MLVNIFSSFKNIECIITGWILVGQWLWWGGLTLVGWVDL
jgi:hypothetical protein